MFFANGLGKNGHVASFRCHRFTDNTNIPKGICFAGIDWQSHARRRIHIVNTVPGIPRSVSITTRGIMRLLSLFEVIF